MPESVHKELTKPAVITRAGVIIKPMDQTELLKDPDIRAAVEVRMQLKGQLPTDTHDNNKKKILKKTQLPLPLLNSKVKIKKFSRKTSVARINYQK